MDSPISSLLLVLIGKCLLNWAVVLLQRRHVGQSFLGFLCVSLALSDLLLALALSTIYWLQDFQAFGLRVTTHHFCLLIHVACLVYGLLHWPAFLLAGLDHSWAPCLSLQPLHWARRLAYALGVCLVWTTALLYVAATSGSYPDVREDSYLQLHQCPVTSSPQSTQVSGALLLGLFCALLHSWATFPWPQSKPKGRYASGRGWSAQAPLQPWLSLSTGLPSSKHVLRYTLGCFLDTWGPLVVLLAGLLLLQVEVPAFLDLNVPWLCFLNSFLTGAALWGRSLTLGCRKTAAFRDGFCEWNFRLDSADVSHDCTVRSCMP